MRHYILPFSILFLLRIQQNCLKRKNTATVLKGNSDEGTLFDQVTISKKCLASQANCEEGPPSCHAGIIS